MNTITTLSGVDINLDSPSVQHIQLLDIARGLANTQVDKSFKNFYSVAQRNVCMSRWIDPHMAMYALMYNGSLAYVDARNDLLNMAVEQAFGLPVILELDESELLQRGLERGICSARKAERAGSTESFWSPANSYAMFMQRYLELTD